MRYRPQLSQASRALTRQIEACDENGAMVNVALAGEHPLALYLDKREIVTLMTLGAAPEALAVGYLRNQRLLNSLQEIAGVQVDWQCNAAVVTTRHGISEPEQRLAKRTVTSGCGQGTQFGDLLEQLDDIRLADDTALSQSALYTLLDQVRRHDTVYKQAGAVHGCALMAGGEILYYVEDVGRHNAVDAIAGQMWLDDVAGADKIFYTTGRLTSEMVIKTAQMGIPILISRSGLTQMGYEIACRLGLTLIGRAQGKHYLLYSGARRFQR